MKTLITFTILFFLCSGIQKKHFNGTDFIVITHTGMEEKHIRGLIISKRSINVDEIEESFYNTELLGAKAKNASLSLLYDFSVTDQRTYQSIVDFASNNRPFFPARLSVPLSCNDEKHVSNEAWPRAGLVV